MLTSTVNENHSPNAIVKFHSKFYSEFSRATMAYLQCDQSDACILMTSLVTVVVIEKFQYEYFLPCKGVWKWD